MKKILIFLMSAAVAVSCSDDIFDVDPSGKVSSETRDEVVKEDPDKVLQGIEASIYTHYATYYKNDLQWLTGFKGFELAFGMAGQDMTLLLQHSMNLYMYQRLLAGGVYADFQRVEHVLHSDRHGQ